MTAGEHGDYSRVVFALGGRLPYRSEPEAAGLRLVFPDARLEFDYGGVHPGRRAHRVVMAEPGSGQDGTSFRLSFGCDCSARTFMLGDRLVVDVFDGGPNDGSPSESEVAPSAGPSNAPPAAAPLAEVDAGPAPSGNADDAGGELPRPEFLRQVESLGNGRSGTLPATAPPEAGFDPGHLERMLAWAIEHGHLTGVEGDDGAPQRPGPATAADPPAAATADPSPATPSAPPDQPGPSAATLDPAAAAEPQAAVQQPGIREAGAGSAPAEVCPNGAALDMAALAGTGSFAEELARRQDELSRALAADQGVEGAQYALAGFYLARLMPQEALQVLRAADEPAPTRIWLEAIALALAERAGASAARASLASACHAPDTELWQAVLDAADGALAQQAFEREAIPLRLAAYPVDLRIELALRLAEAGIDAGAAPAAIERFLGMVEQVAPADQALARLLYLRGRLAAARGDFAAARAYWGEAAALPGEAGLRATLALVSSQLDDGELDETAALSALERLAYDWRGHPAQLAIARLTSAIHERRGDVSLALHAIEEVALGAEGRPSGRTAARLASDLIRRTYTDPASARPLDRLAAFWRYEGFVPPGSEGTDIRLAVARALGSRGLPNAAVRLMEPLVRATDDPAHQQVVDLLAESYLAADEPTRALDLLRATSPRASASRPARNLSAARALAALGRFAEAAGVLHDNPDAAARPLRADLLWKAGLWREAAAAYRDLVGASPQDQPDPESVVRFAAAAYMAAEPAPAGGAPGMAEAVPEIAAFAPYPAVQGTEFRAGAAQLLDGAAKLGLLAERYGLGGTGAP